MSTSEIFPSCQSVPQDLEMANIDDITFASIKEHKENMLKSEEKVEPQDECCSYRVAKYNPIDYYMVGKTNAEDYTRKGLKLEAIYAENLDPPPECCIYRVPNDLRKMNEGAYTPHVVSIGPLHYGCNQAMEIKKFKFVQEFGKRISDETWLELETFIKQNVQGIRSCYAEMPTIEDSMLTRMILIDAVFIVEYILRCWNPGVGSDNLMKSLLPVKSSIWTDLLLLENQLPYFVLEGLYKLAFSKHEDMYPSFFSLSIKFLCPRNDRVNELPIDQSDKKKANHFTDLRRYAMIKMHHVELKPLLQVDRDLPCAVRLQESGVKFKHFEQSECLLDIKVRKKKLLRIPCFNCELQIPKIEINDQTECLFRNLMALEQCHYPDQTHICSYIELMDNLINTEADVNLLVEAGIIFNCVGDIKRIARMFNELCRFISVRGSPYDDVVKELRSHYQTGWNHAKATLRRVYFGNPWRGTGTVAAVLLLILTVIQTICSIKSAV